MLFQKIKQTTYYPLVVLGSGAILSLLVWFILPQTWMDEWRVPYRAPFLPLLLVFMTSMLFFGCGLLFSNLAKNKKTGNGLENKYEPLFLIGTLISLGAFLILLVLTYRSYGIMGLFSPRTLKDSFLAGITTWTTVSMILIPYGYAIKRITGVLSIKCYMFLAINLLIVLYLGGFSSQRLYVFIPLVAVFFIYLYTSRISLFWLSFIVGFAAVFLLLAFVGFEYFRSFSDRLETTNAHQNLIFYGTQRLFIYLGFSVNTGGARLDLYLNEGIGAMPFGSFTLNPFYQIYAKIPFIGPFGFFQEPDYGFSTDIMASMGMYNEEFTNTWGIAMPFLEGILIGLIFWLFWGFIIGRFHRLAVFTMSPANLTLASFSLAALLDSSARVNLLGSTQILVPMIFFAILCKVLPKEFKENA